MTVVGLVQWCWVVWSNQPDQGYGGEVHCFYLSFSFPGQTAGKNCHLLELGRLASFSFSFKPEAGIQQAVELSSWTQEIQIRSITANIELPEVTSDPTPLTWKTRGSGLGIISSVPRIWTPETANIYLIFYPPQYTTLGSGSCVVCFVVLTHSIGTPLVAKCFFILIVSVLYTELYIKVSLSAGLK